MKESIHLTNKKLVKKSDKMSDRKRLKLGLVQVYFGRGKTTVI